MMNFMKEKIIKKSNKKEYSYNEILKEIYREVFCNIKDRHIIVFLCGGASTKNQKSLRDKTRKLIEVGKIKFNRHFPIKIFYPEDLVIDMFNNTKDADLLSFEKFLADHSHIIVIICESPGALVELGAFTNNEYTKNKVIASIDKKRLKDKSFIMLGPIRYLKKHNRYNVVEYTSNTNKFVDDLIKKIRDKHKKENMVVNVSINTIIGMYYLIQILLYYFKSLTWENLLRYVERISKEENIGMKKLDLVINASLKLLFNDKKIIKESKDTNIFVYELTQDGYKSVKKVIENCTSREKCDRIRIKIMYCNFYKSSLS